MGERKKRQVFLVRGLKTVNESGQGVWSASGANFAVEEGHTEAIREVV
jgi:hypothetical protein